MHRDVMRKLLERVRARHEVRLAVQLHEHADFSAGVNVAADEPFGRFARGLLRRSSLAFLAQYRDGLFEVALRFNQRRAAIVESRVCAVAQFLHELGWNFHGRIWCAHPFFL